MANEQKRFLNDAYALESLRETGYKNTAYAISELIDNSIDAGAENINLVAQEEVNPNNPRHPYRIAEIGLIDDGNGFPSETLDDCLSIGFGTKKDDGGPSSIGKFGYGLKGGSISQCRRFEVYTWSNGAKPSFCYMDLDEIKNGNPYIPGVTKKDLPKHFKPYAKDKGTLIIWQKLDRIDWKTSAGLFGNMKEDLERIFRNFLDDDDTYGKKRIITMEAVDENGEPKAEKTVLRANDPTYLLRPNSLPDVNKDEVQGDHELSARATNSIFEKYTKKIQYRDENGQLKESEIEFIFTLADTDIQALGGNSLVGTHYGKNNDGVSFMRECREIEQSTKQINRTTDSDPRHRWWGAEVRFSRELDGLFGVDAAKQRIRNIKKINPDSMDKYREESMLTDDNQDLVKRLNLTIHTEVSKQVDKMMAKIKARKAGIKSSQQTGTKTPQDEINEKLKETGDLANNKSTQEALKKSLKDKEAEARERIKANNPAISEDELNLEIEKYLNKVLTFGKDSWGEFGSFLNSKYAGNSLEVLINTEHPFFEHFYDKFEQDETNQQPVEALKIILQGYALAEDKLSYLDPENKIYPKLRDEWGRFVSEYIEKSKLSN